VMGECVVFRNYRCPINIQCDPQCCGLGEDVANFCCSQITAGIFFFSPNSAATRNGGPASNRGLPVPGISFDGNTSDHKCAWEQLSWCCLVFDACLATFCVGAHTGARNVSESATPRRHAHFQGCRWGFPPRCTVLISVFTR